MSKMSKEPDPLGQAVTDYIDGLEGKKPMGEATIAGEAEFTNEQRSRLPYIMALYHSCFLCNADPPPARLYTWKTGEQTIVTPICPDCSRGVDLQDRLFKAVRRRFAG